MYLSTDGMLSETSGFRPVSAGSRLFCVVLSMCGPPLSCSTLSPPCSPRTIPSTAGAAILSGPPRYHPYPAAGASPYYFDPEYICMLTGPAAGSAGRLGAPAAIVSRTIGGSSGRVAPGTRRLVGRRRGAEFLITCPRLPRRRRAPGSAAGSGHLAAGGAGAAGRVQGRDEERLEKYTARKMDKRWLEKRNIRARNGRQMKRESALLF